MSQFKLVHVYRHWWPVSVALPDPENPGKVIRQELEILFEPVPQDEARRLDAEFAKLTTADQRSDHENNLLVRVSKNWRNVIGEDGQEVGFSEDAFRQALRFPYFRAAAYRAYAQSLSGDEARLGN